MSIEQLERSAVKTLEPLTLEQLILISGGTGEIIAETGDQLEVNKDIVKVEDPSGGPNEPGSGDRDIGGS
jgi:hypothetical protein